MIQKANYHTKEEQQYWLQLYGSAIFIELFEHGCNVLKEILQFSNLWSYLAMPI